MGIDALRERLRFAVATGLAMGVSGCGSVVPDDDTAGSTASGGGSTTGGDDDDDASAGPGTSPTASATTSDTTTGRPGSEAEAEGPIVLDVSNPPPPVTCQGAPSMPACARPGEFDQAVVVCLERKAGAPCEEFEERDVLDASNACADLGSCLCPAQVACSLPPTDDACCYEVILSFCCPGRPFVVDGCARVPAAHHREDWSVAIRPGCSGLSDRERMSLAAAWATEAGFEAASVASFSRFLLQLVSLGAPAALLVDAQQALAEEIQHARILYGLASAYGGTPLGPGPLPIDGALGVLSSPVEIAVSLAAEGCIGETVSALQLQLAADRAADPILRAALTAIAEEETRHAELAWRTLAWMLQGGDDDLRGRVCEVFANATDHVPIGAREADGLAANVLHAHGRMTTAELRLLAARALGTVVAPAADALLRSTTTTADPLATAGFAPFRPPRAS